MIPAKQRAHRFAESIRKKEREELMASKRQWIEVPSPVFELPHRIEAQQWEHFELLLDSLAEKDFALIDEPFRDYLLEQWQRVGRQDWQDETTINLIRALFRLGIADKHHARQLLGLAAGARGSFESDERAAETMLRLLKEVAINLERSGGSINEDEDFWTGELRDQLNHLTSSLRICRLAGRCAHFQELLKEQLVYYVVLLADRRVQLEEFVRVRNVGELYLLLSDCFGSNDSFLLAKAMQLIRKALKIEGNEEVARCLHGLQVLLTDGIQAAQRFVDGEPPQHGQKGVFFHQFLKMASRADVPTLLSAVELLATLFDQFDECIPAAFGARTEPTVYNDPPGVQVNHPREYCSLGELLESLLESLMVELRVKAYWLISNVTGSSLYFRQHGLQLIRHIYLHDYALEEGQLQAIAKDLAICVLNYLCNVTQQEELEELAAIVSEERAEKEEGVKRAPNCFLFCLSVAADILERICFTADSHHRIFSEQSYLAIIHRAVFALFMVVNHAGPLKQTALSLLQRERVETHLERLLEGLGGQGELCKLLESVLGCLSSGEGPL